MFSKNSNVHGKVTINTPKGPKSFWVFKEDNKVAGLKCSCTGKTTQTATQMKYNHETEKVECPHCGKQPEVIETPKEYRAKQEAEIQARINKKPLELHKTVFDYSTGIQYYSLNKRIPDEDWKKVADLFTYMNENMFQDADYAAPGWYTREPEKVEQILNITNTQTKQEENKIEQAKHDKEQQKHLNHIEEAFNNANPLQPTKFNELIKQGKIYDHPHNSWAEHDLYGGGILYIIQDDKILKIKNNGHDNDDWSRNNIQTGGAGAIGVEVPYSTELATEIQETCNEYHIK
jgi:hypothetical protein